ncbi:MAG TPA: NAD(P)H-binding protein [Chitinophagaceae bacterium]
MKILVIGASGMIGKPVTIELAKAGYELTLLSRNPHQMRQLYPKMKIVEGDVLDQVSLMHAMEGQDAVYISMQAPRGALQSHPQPEREGIDNIIDAATYGGIKRIVYLSSLVQNYNGMNGFHWWVFDMKQSAVEKIKSCGIPYTIFYASALMENLDQFLMKGNKILLAGVSKTPMYFIAGEDYGRQVGWSFRIPATENKEYVAQGLEAFTWDEAAKVFINNYSKSRLRIVKAPMKVLKLAGMLNSKSYYGYKIVTALNNYPEKFEAEQTWSELGKPSITLAAYAQMRSNITSPPALAK